MPGPLDNVYLSGGGFGKALSLSENDPAWRVFGSGHTPYGDAIAEYRRVPYLYAAVDKRAKAVSLLPYGIYGDDDTDLAGQDMFRGLVRGLRQRLYLTEAALCLYGRAYWLQSRNRFGLNTRYDWIVPTSITERYEPLRGLDYFRRTVIYDKADGRRHIEDFKPITEPRGRMAYFWQPNLTSEIGPGVAPASVALAGAGILDNMTDYVAGFFHRGAVRPMMLKIPPKTSKAEKEQVEAWWRRFFSGVWNSHRAKAITNTVEVETVGDSLDEMASEELTTIAREDVCAAMGVPHSLISADAANYATSQQDALNFYQQTVLPSATLIAEIINDQIMPDGYELVFHPEQLEVFQQHEVSKAQALSTLTGQPILTVDEARAMLGYEPLGAAEPEPAVDDTELDNGDDMEVLEAIKARLDDLAFWTESEGEYANGHYLDL